MPKFGSVSESWLLEADPRLVRVCRRAIKVFDFSVMNVHTRAIDLAPWPVDWSAVAWPHVRFGVLAGVITAAGYEESVRVLWGLREGLRKNWTAGQLPAVRFLDWGHFELGD